MYVKCATPDVAVAASRTMQGRWFAGKSKKVTLSVCLQAYCGYWYPSIIRVVHTDSIQQLDYELDISMR